MKNINAIKDKQFLVILFDIKKEILNLFGGKLEHLILYGSYARNEQDPESDIDVMILVNEQDGNLKKYNYKIADIMTDLSLKYDVFISLTEETVNRYNKYLDVLPFYQNIFNEGIEIYGKKAA